MIKTLALQLAVWPVILAAQDPPHVRPFAAIDVFTGRDLLGRRSCCAESQSGTPFTRHATRDGVPSVHIVMLRGDVASTWWRFRATMNGGTGVESVGDIRLAPHEAFGGIRLGPVWLDAGLQASHTGMESWLHLGNPTYTRSLIADYAARHHEAIGFTWSATRWIDAHARVVSGWEGLSAEHEGGVGARIDFRPAPGLAISGFNLITREPQQRLRRLHGFGARLERGPLIAQLQADLGSQENSAPLGRPAHWYGYSASGRFAASRRAAVSARFERFDDDEQVVLNTGSSGGTPNAPFRGYGESFGVDLTWPRAMWRTEVRAFQNSGRSFSSGGATPARSAGFVVTSVTLVAGSRLEPAGAGSPPVR